MTVYYATSACSPALAQLIARELGALSSASGARLRCFALVDGCADESLITSRKAPSGRRYSLYAGTRLADFGNAAPQLIEAPGEAPEAWLTDWIRACSGKPMLSFIGSPLPGAELVEHLRPWLIARSRDGLEWPLRLADTRVLPRLIGALSGEESTLLLAPIWRWWLSDREGQAIVIEGQAGERPTPAWDAWPIGDETFAQLLDAAEADTILATLFDTQPDLLATHSPARNHQLVDAQLRLANRYGIMAAPDRQHFASLGLMLKPDFSQHPEMKTLLQRCQQGAAYFAELAGLSDDFWQTCHK